MPTDRYAARSPEDVTRLVLENPLAWIVSGDAAPRWTLLPIRPRLSKDGRITHLLDHFYFAAAAPVSAGDSAA